MASLGSILKTGKRIDEALAAIRRLRMSNTDAADLARAAYGVGREVDPAAASAIARMNQEVLNLKPIPGLDIANPPKAAAAIKSGLAQDVARIGAENTAAFDRAIPDAVLDDFDWYSLAGLDATNVGRALGFRSPGRQRDVGAGIIARLSPKTPWEMNKKRAMLAAQAYKSGELDRFLTFVDNNSLWGQSLDSIRALAKAAGVKPFQHISGFDTYQAREISEIISKTTGLASLKTGDLAKKIDDFYGAIRLSDPDRAELKRLGVMDPYTEKILDPDYVYMGQRLGDVPTGPVVDKIQSGISQAVPQIGYKGFELPLLDNPVSYRMQSDALQEMAHRVGKTPLRMQSDPWGKRHYLYPDVGGVDAVVQSGGVRTADELASNIDALPQTMAAARRLAKRGLILPSSVTGM